MSRESILKSIGSNKPELVPLPTIDQKIFEEDVNLLDTFINNVTSVGGQVLQTTSDRIDEDIRKLYPNATEIISISEKTSLGTMEIFSETDPHELSHIDLAIVDGEFGVAENGAIWMNEQNSIVRALPFITDHLVIILPTDQLYLHMSKAYDAIANRERSFGLFISGPSKTADIEQSLVIGAHGAMSLVIVLV